MIDILIENSIMLFPESSFASSMGTISKQRLYGRYKCFLSTIDQVDTFYSKLIFDSDLTDGIFENTTSSGRTTRSWPGSIPLFNTIGQSLIIREGKDYQLLN